MPMTKLRQAFRGTVASNIPVMEEALQKLERNDPAGSDTLRRLAHQLRASGGTHGFPDVADAAHRLQQSAPGELRQQARALLDVLRGALASIPAQIRTVLLIDDDPMVTTLLTAALGAPDRSIVAVHSWADAESKLESLRPSLIVLDLMLPDADGRNALISLRERPSTATIPVFIVSSGAGGSVPMAECLALGATRYIEKPFRAKNVAAAAEVALRESDADDWRVDSRTGLLTRAGFKDRYAQPFAAPRFVACIGTANGSSMPERTARALADDANDTLIVASWDANTVAALVTGLDDRETTSRLEDLLTAAEHESGTRLVAGLGAAAHDELLDDAFARAQHRQSLARGGSSPVVSSDASTAKPPVVLLAEDDPLVSMLVRDRLKRAGMEVVHAEDGRTALEVARDRRFSCAILDVKLPALDGFALLTELRKDPNHAGLPVAMLTAMGQEKDVMRGFELGADDYIVKPFSPRELAARIQRLVDRGQNAR